MRGKALRHIRWVSTIGVLAAVAVLSSGCQKLKARDSLNKGVNAFKAGQYPQAADFFKKAVDLDPGFPTARLYLATAYMSQYIPGADSPDNKRNAEEAMKQFQQVLADDPKNLLATQSIANLHYQMKDFDKAEEWNRKVVQVDPNNKEAYYTLGVIAWTKFIAPDREARVKLNMKPEDPGPLKDPKVRQELAEKYKASLDQGIEDEKKALAIDPEYENAMAYMNLLIRYRADLDDTKEQYQADVKEADQWVQKSLETTKIKAERKAANPNAK
jgi:tetratricopeptide (TPR) repeat protein